MSCFFTEASGKEDDYSRSAKTAIIALNDRATSECNDQSETMRSEAIEILDHVADKWSEQQIMIVEDALMAVYAKGRQFQGPQAIRDQALEGSAKECERGYYDHDGPASLLYRADAIHALKGKRS